MAYRDDRSERWDRDRFRYDRDDRSRFSEDRVRFEERDSDRVTFRRSPSATRIREDERRRVVYRDDEDDFVRDRRYYEDDRRPGGPYMRRAVSPPRREEVDHRRVVIEKERVVRSPSPGPVRRPGHLLRRQSSLDTYDRPVPRGFESRVEYGPPARREDYRPLPAYVNIPLPRRRLEPPPGSRGRYETYEDIKVSEPDHYGDEEYRSYPERVREREILHTRHRVERSRSRSRSHSRERSHSRVSRHRSTKGSSSSRSSSSSSTHTKTTVKSVKSEYPKKGKTRIPAKLLSKRAIIDLGYPFEEDGSTIIILKALGQDNIDDLLRLSEDYKKAEHEVVVARSVEERTEEIVVREPAIVHPAPVIIDAIPPMAPIPPPPVAVSNTTTLVVRDPSPARSCSTSTSSTSRTPVVIEASPRVREISEEIAVGPLALIEGGHHHHHRRHRSRHSRHRSLSRGEIVRAERLSNGELVIYEERVEKIEEPRRGVRIEKDRKGRLSISVPKHR